MKRPRRKVALALLLVGVALVAVSAYRHLRAMSLMLRLAHAPRQGLTGAIAGAFEAPVLEENVLLRSRAGAFRARLYRPRDGSRGRGLVLAHGVHYLGIDEPRLVTFAQELARTGVIVLTPELASLTDYRVQASSVEEIRASVVHLSASPWVRDGRVGVMGASFAGGLALRAATDPTLQSRLAFVFSMGGHTDLGRVTRFLTTDELVTPTGVVHMRAHDYGLVVFVYAYAERFVDAGSLYNFKDALRLFLQQNRRESERVGAYLQGDARWLYERVLAHDKTALRARVEAVLPSVRGVMSEGSPGGHLALVRCPVYLLHGADDDVIPATESRFAAMELEAHTRVHLLVTTAVDHVTVRGRPTARQQWEVVHFMAGLLSE